jgi:cobalamin biosynthesis protein CobT
VLQRRQRLGRRAGYVTGQRIDLRRAMAFVGSPRKPLNLWVRPSMPDRRSAAFLLLVDLSGSMRGPKIEHAMRGAVLFAETLARLQIPMSVWGFQDELVPAIGFGQAFDDDARGRLRSLAHEVSGSRPGGHNRPAFNDDGPCLREAAAHLLDRSEDDRVLVVLSDGHPEGRRSSARDLHHAVSTLAPLLSLVGIGLGPGTEHVSDYYPRALASVSLEALPTALGGVLRQSLALAA